MACKGRGIADDSSWGKRKRDGDDQSGYRKRKDMILADESSSSDDEHSMDDASLQNDFGSYLEAKAEPKTPNIPFHPKEEKMDEEDPKKFSEERYNSFRSKYSGVSVGSWARVRRGKYMGDLAQVVNVNEFQMKATVKLLPRLDLQSVAAKSSGGIYGSNYTSPSPRLITSRELDAYRSRVRSSLDPDTGDLYEVFDGMKLKDGYVFKKLALDSLGCYNCNPSEAELITFSPGKKDESSKKKKQSMDNDKAGEGSLSSDMENSFDVSDLVIHARNAFGVVIGREKDGCIKVLEEGSERPMVVAVKARFLKKAAIHNSRTAFDQHKKFISVNDTVRVLEGPLEDKQGIVKQIYKGVVFLHDENEQENCGYFCAKAQICEKMELSADLFKGKGGKSGASVLGTDGGAESESEPEPVDFAGLPEASFVEKLRSGAQELGDLMEEAASRCLGRVSVEDQLRSALMELESCKERVSAVEAERDTLRKSLEQERAKIIYAFGRLLTSDLNLVTHMKKEGITLEDLPTWCASYKSSPTADV